MAAVTPCGCRVDMEPTWEDVPGIISCPLHAAAPALLDALRDLLDHAGGDDWAAVLATENARAAIRRATEGA